MIQSISGDILRADAEALVNPVNCVGVMGKGLAEQFNRAFPDNFRVYQVACKRGELKPGAMLVVATQTLTNPLVDHRLTRRAVRTAVTSSPPVGMRGSLSPVIFRADPSPPNVSS